MNRIARWTTFALAALATPLVGCNVSTEGENNLVRFTYDDPVVTFGASLDTAIAAGTRATLDVQSLDATAGIRIRGAKVDPPEIAEVVDSGLTNLVLEGLTPGEAQLTIETDRGTDLGTIRVAEAATVGVKSVLDTEKVLLGGTEVLTIERRDSVGQVLVGVAPAQLDVAPSAAAEQVPSDVDHEFRLRYLEAGGQNFQVGDSMLPREVVTADAVAEFAFAETLEGAAIEIGAEVPAIIEVKDAAGEAIGAVEGVLTLQSTTPEICTVRFQRQLYMPGLVLEGVSAGKCIVEGTIGGLSKQIQVDIEG